MAEFMQDHTRQKQDGKQTDGNSRLMGDQKKNALQVAMQPPLQPNEQKQHEQQQDRAN